MWTHFAEDARTLSQDGQYMWSDSILFTPVLTEGATDVTGYFPKSWWYSLTDDGFIDASVAGQSVTFDTPISTTNVHVRGGSIIPMQQAGMTTKAVKESPMTLLVALDTNGAASGSLYLDDGVQNELTVLTYIDYSLSDGILTSVRATGYSYETPVQLEKVVVQGIDRVYGTSCSSEMTLENDVGSSVVVMPSSTEVTVGEFYASLTLTFENVNITSDFVLSLGCTDDGDDDSVLDDVYVQVAISVACIAAVGALAFVGLRWYKSTTKEEDALLGKSEVF